MKTQAKIVSRRELAIQLSNGPVALEMVSVRLAATVKMWERHKEVIVNNGVICLA